MVATATLVHRRIPTDERNALQLSERNVMDTEAATATEAVTEATENPDGVTTHSQASSVDRFHSHHSHLVCIVMNDRV